MDVQVCLLCCLSAFYLYIHSFRSSKDKRRWQNASQNTVNYWISTPGNCLVLKYSTWINHVRNLWCQFSEQQTLSSQNPAFFLIAETEYTGAINQMLLKLLSYLKCANLNRNRESSQKHRITRTCGVFFVCFLQGWSQ